MENLANWVIETPTFSMDATPLMTLLSDLVTTQQTQQREAMLAGSQARLTHAQAAEQERRTSLSRSWNKSIMPRTALG